ncbi:ABC transporter substrate-binding protein [Desertibaculum subflavum]|uniref:ABC transporter substrate-binding protein n=1 Tax=Desertibaculum subflavum TaxID=2268458 RepID=UPI0034D18877
MTTISRRSMLAAGAAGVTLFNGPWRHNRVWAQKSAKPILIGLTHDASGQFANSGQDEQRGTVMAIEEINAKGGVLGRKLSYITADTETTPATATRVAERMINRNEVAFIVGAIQSGVANAIGQVAQKYGVVYFNTNSSSPTEAGKDCQRVKFVWDGTGANFANANAANVVNTFGKKWLLLTNDYVWGHNTSKATRQTASKFGAEMADEILVPVGTRDFSPILLKVQQIKPDVVAAAVGGDDLKVMQKQVVDMKLARQPAWLQNQLDWPDVYGLGVESVFGVFGTTWYHKLDLPGVADLVKRYQARWPETRIDVPGNVFYNGYMAMHELAKAIERAGSTNNIKVIKALEGHKMAARDRMQHFDAYIDPVSHHVQQTIYLASGNDKPVDKTDYFKILSQVEPDKAKDPNEAANCKLQPYDKTPTYEM